MGIYVVKGPGDRLQDNQRRWLAYCEKHQLPVEVLCVRWMLLRERAGTHSSALFLRQWPLAVASRSGASW